MDYGVLKISLNSFLYLLIKYNIQKIKNRNLLLKYVTDIINGLLNPVYNNRILDVFYNMYK